MSEKTKIESKENKRGYSPAEVAQMYGIGRSTVYDEIYEKRLGAYKIGSRTIVPAESLKVWEESNIKQSKILA